MPDYSNSSVVPSILALAGLGFLSALVAGCEHDIVARRNTCDVLVLAD